MIAPRSSTPRTTDVWAHSHINSNRPFSCWKITLRLRTQQPACEPHASVVTHHMPHPPLSTTECCGGVKYLSIDDAVPPSIRDGYLISSHSGSLLPFPSFGSSPLRLPSKRRLSHTLVSFTNIQLPPARDQRSFLLSNTIIPIALLTQRHPQWILCPFAYHRVATWTY